MDFSDPSSDREVAPDVTRPPPPLPWRVLLLLLPLLLPLLVTPVGGVDAVVGAPTRWSGSANGRRGEEEEEEEDAERLGSREEDAAAAAAADAAAAAAADRSGHSNGKAGLSVY